MPKYATDGNHYAERFNSPTMESKPAAPRQTTQVVAKPVDAYVQQGTEQKLGRLLESLNYFGGNLTKYLQQAEERQAEEDKLLGFKNAKEGGAVPPEASKWFQVGHIQGYWENAAMESADRASVEYQAMKDDPSFDLQGFLEGKVRDDLKGVTNPYAVQTYMKRFGELGSELSRNYTAHQADKLYKQRDADFNGSISGVVGRLGMPLGNPQALSKDTAVEMVTESFARAKAQGITHTEALKSLIVSLEAESERQGGRPDLFDIFNDQRLNIGEYPKEALEVEHARGRAEGLFDKEMQNAVHLRNGDTLAELHDAIKNEEWGKVSDEALDLHRTRYGALWSNEKYLSIREARDRAMAESRKVGIGMEYADAGALHQLPPAEQKKVLAELSKEHLTTIVQNLHNTDPKPVADAIKAIMRITERTGASEVLDEIVRFGDHIANLAPPVNENAPPPPVFQNVATIYQAVESSGNGVQLMNYFPHEKTRALLDSFLSNREAGDTIEGAYRGAYASQKQENIDLASQFIHSPDGDKMIDNAIKGITRKGFLPFFGVHLGGTVAMENPDFVKAWAKREAERYIKASGQPNNVEKHLDRVARNRFIQDREDNTIIDVPPGHVGEDTVKSISYFRKTFTAERTKANGIDTKITMLHLGEGRYRVRDETTYEIVKDITLDDIKDLYKRDRVVLASDREIADELSLAAREGRLTLDTVKENQRVIDKLVMFGERSRLKDAKEFVEFSKAQRDRQRFYSSSSSGAYGAWARRAPHTRLTDDSRIPSGASKNNIASTLMEQGDMKGALTVLGEGVALTAYADPSRGVCIGIGYNIDANINTASDDFRRAGITASVADIKSGKVSISEEQAVRLYKAVAHRYEEVARKAYQEGMLKSGIPFDGLMPQTQAVLVDMAYQVGGNLHKFKVLIRKISDGQPFNSSDLLTYYGTHNGERKYDANRANLRMSFIDGTLDLGLKTLSGKK
jgi:hypothetical protein